MEERLLREINRSNPWWIREKEKVEEYKRKQFTEIASYLKKRQIIGIVGLRRVGKTVMMKQLINLLLKEIPPENILFFTFEDEWNKKEILEEILYYHLENKSKDGKRFIFLDEIQLVEGWEYVLKRFYDREQNIKFIVSGSASLSITKSIESLAGRIYDFVLYPLTFHEFLELNELNLDYKKVEKFNEYKKLYDKIIYLKERILHLFSEFIIRGGFPEISKEINMEVIRKYIKNSVVEKIVLKDIPKEFEVRKIDILEGIVKYAARETSKLYTIKNMSMLLKTDKETISNYLNYLEKSFIIYTIYNYSKSATKQLRTNKKLHILPSVAIALENYSNDILNYPELVGNYIESLIAIYGSYVKERVFFWRTPQKDEVDIVLKNKQIIPVEVKYQNQITKNDFGSLIKFMDKFKLREGILVTKSLLKEEIIEGKKIMFIPAWLFLLAF